MGTTGESPSNSAAFGRDTWKAQGEVSLEFLVQSYKMNYISIKVFTKLRANHLVILLLRARHLESTGGMFRIKKKTFHRNTGEAPGNGYMGSP
jgi:hypothetical protein